MISGKAVQEHMEDVYHDMLKVCHLVYKLLSLLHHSASCALVWSRQFLQTCVSQWPGQP